MPKIPRCRFAVAASVPAVLFLAVAVFGDDPRPLPITGAADQRLAPLDRLMISFMAEHEVPGAALAVSREGCLVYARGFGCADLESRRPVEPDALFRIASISKPITSAAVMKLVQEERFTLDARVVELLRDHPKLERLAVADDRFETITVRQLLRHTAGFDRAASLDPMTMSFAETRKVGLESPATSIDIIRFMAARPLDFDPRQRYAYSNFGYCLLGRVIEAVSGRPYEEYVRDEVLAPMRIERMRLGRTLGPHRAEGEVSYYVRGDRKAPAVTGDEPGQDVPVPYGGWYLEAMDSHGGWIASAPDLVRFIAVLDPPDDSGLLRPSTIGSMLERPPGLAGYHEDGKPRAAYYACGWNVRPIGDSGGRNVWHGGGLDGTSTLLVRRHDRFCWAVLFNRREGNDGRSLASLIDPLVHRAVDEVNEWPEPKECLRQGG